VVGGDFNQTNLISVSHIPLIVTLGQ